MICLDNIPFIIMLTAGSCNIVLLLWKKNHVLKCCIFGESHQILVTRFLVFGTSLHGTSLHCGRKCKAKLYATYVAGAWQSLRKNRSLNCQLIPNSVIQIHSFCLAGYYAGLTLIVFSSYWRKSRRQHCKSLKTCFKKKKLVLRKFFLF